MADITEQLVSDELLRRANDEETVRIVDENLADEYATREKLEGVFDHATDQSLAEEGVEVPGAAR